MARILAITGATGRKSGGVLAQRISENIEVIRNMFPDGIRALVRNSSDTKLLEKQISGIEIYKGNFIDTVFLENSLKNIDTLLHIVGIRWSDKMIDAAIACGVRRIIFVHTTGIYSKYKGASKDYKRIEPYVIEQCKKNGIVFTILRPTMIYGTLNDWNIIEFIKMVDKFPIMPVVNGARYELQPVHYKDLGQAYYDVLINEETTANRDFNLSGGEPILLRDMLKVIGEKLGKKVRFISCPFPIAYGGAWMVYLLSFKKVDYRERVQRLCEPRFFSHKEATEAFGYDPMQFETGVTDEVNQYMKLKGKA